MKKAVFVLVAAVTLFGVVAGAWALGPITGDTVSDTVVITAGINSKITVVAPGDIAYGWKDPDSIADTRSGIVTVWSNVPYSLEETTTRNDFPGSVFGVTGGDLLNGSVDATPAVDGHQYTRLFTLNPSVATTWMASTGTSSTLEADVRYTAVVR